MPPMGSIDPLPAYKAGYFEEGLGTGAGGNRSNRE